jgi:hypothetical protein
MMGRPTKYTPELVVKAKTYLDNYSTVVPTVEDFALYLDINRDTVYDWKNKHDEFSDIVDKVLHVQASKLIDGSLRGELNSSISKLILSGKHNYVEKKEVDNNITGDVSFINSVPRVKNEDSQST